MNFLLTYKFINYISLKKFSNQQILAIVTFELLNEL